jgi:cell division protein FtsW (lipid II flippase)
MPRLTRPDVWLLAAIGGLLGLGIVMVFNVSYFHAQEQYGDPLLFFRKHLVSLAIGIVAMAVASRLRPEVLERWANVLSSRASRCFSWCWSPASVSTAAVRGVG